MRYCAATVKISFLIYNFHFLLDNKGSFLYNNFCCEQQAQLAQLVEQRTENPCVSGSIPELGICGCSSMVEHQPSKLDTWVRFPSPAFLGERVSKGTRFFYNLNYGGFPMEKKTAFKDLSRKAKVQYIWDYYRWHIIAAICLVAFVISMIVHYAAYRESVLDIVMVNTLNPYEENVSSTDEFFEQEGFTKKEEVTVDTSITFSDDDNYSTNYYSDQKLTLKLSVGGADVLFAPEFVFQQYADAGSLMPLTDYLTADELEQYKDMIVYATDSETGETLPCGLELNDNQWLSDYGYYTGTVCFGIAYATDNKGNAVDFFHYVMN